MSNSPVGKLVRRRLVHGSGLVPGGGPIGVLGTDGGEDIGGVGADGGGIIDRGVGVIDNAEDTGGVRGEEGRIIDEEAEAIDGEAGRTVDVERTGGIGSPTKFWLEVLRFDCENGVVVIIGVVEWD